MRFIEFILWAAAPACGGIPTRIKLILLSKRFCVISWWSRGRKKTSVFFLVNFRAAPCFVTIEAFFSLSHWRNKSPIVRQVEHEPVGSCGNFEQTLLLLSRLNFATSTPAAKSGCSLSAQNGGLSACSHRRKADARTLRWLFQKARITLATGEETTATNVKLAKKASLEVSWFSRAALVC
ncbi:uncharacterized protein LOC9653569 [Selaginella moellendorffii]|uniref:uncharacterized protein LOC9653569 n=1 Tax=Selaginella moellendorffii TaxID=88036 RepID=UPI000D1CD879|nr:uncharacterized protein LOC9653569 [Selaginella moellendorffii]|eukprot:XP_024539229.1 uncharacterized protein LOC9653569 [Selaginella moellendorffii]